MWPQLTSNSDHCYPAAPNWKRERETMKARKRNYGKRKRNYGSKKLVRSRRNGRAWARGRKEWGKSVGSARGTCRQCVGESPSESAFIGHLLLLLPVGERPELPWSTLLCGSSVVAGQQPVCCVLLCCVLCAVPWWGRGSAFNEIPLILWPEALLVSHLQTAL